jgi:O-antigen/teichoic acid export membrane protein
MTEYKLFAQRVGLVGVTNFIVGLRGLILIPILTKTLGAFGYGIWSQIIVTISLAMPLAMLGLSQAMVRFLAPEKDKKDIQEGFFSIFFIVLSFSILLSLILFSLSDFFALIIIKDISIAPIIRIAAFVIALTAIDQTIFSFFTAFRQMKKYSLFVILENFIEVGLIAYAVLSGFGIFGAVIALLISRAILLIIIFPYIVSKIGFKLPDFSKLKSYLSFGLPMVPATIFAWIIHSSDRYIIGYFMGSVPVGIYSAAYGIGFVIMMFMNPIGIVLFPTISKLWDEEKITEFKTHLRYSLKYFLMLAIPSLFGISVLAKELLLILSTSEFVSGAILIPFVASGVVVYGVYNIFNYVLTLQNAQT